MASALHHFFCVKKLKILCSLNHTILFKIHQHVVQILFSMNVWRDFRLPISALATVTRKSFNGKFILQIWFSDRVFYVTITDAVGSLKVSPYIVWYVFGPRAGVIWTKSYGSYGPKSKFWAFWQKMFDHFWQSVDVILENVSVTEAIAWCWTTIFQCFKNNGSRTRGTRLKVATNMAYLVHCTCCMQTCIFVQTYFSFPICMLPLYV